MPKYEVTVNWNTQQCCTTTITVEAEDEDAAKSVAVHRCRTHSSVVWSDHEIVDGQMDAVHVCQVEK